MHSIRDFDVAFLPPATEWAKVIFTVRNSSCGKVYTPQADTPTPADTQPGQTPPPPWADSPLPGQTPGQTHPGQTPPPDKHPPSLGQTPP